MVRRIEAKSRVKRLIFSRDYQKGKTKPKFSRVRFKTPSLKTRKISNDSKLSFNNYIRRRRDFNLKKVKNLKKCQNFYQNLTFRKAERNVFVFLRPKTFPPLLDFRGDSFKIKEKSPPLQKKGSDP
jgi:hypothetical protein